MNLPAAGIQQEPKLITVKRMKVIKTLRDLRCSIGEVRLGLLLTDPLLCVVALLHDDVVAHFLVLDHLHLGALVLHLLLYDHLALLIQHFPAALHEDRPADILTGGLEALSLRGVLLTHLEYRAAVMVVRNTEIFVYLFHFLVHHFNTDRHGDILRCDVALDLKLRALNLLTVSLGDCYVDTLAFPLQHWQSKNNVI